MQITIEDGVLQVGLIRQAHKDVLASVFNQSYDTYLNPFESKTVLHKPYAPSIERVLTHLYDVAYEQTNNPSIDPHFTAVMIYSQCDYLLPHYDAQVNPITNKIKGRTYLYYLSGGAPTIINGVHVPAVPNRLVSFDGSTMLHSMPAHAAKAPRVVITFSQSLFGELPSARSHAYFVDVDNTWSQDKLNLRDKRAAHETAQEVYIA